MLIYRNTQESEIIPTIGRTTIKLDTILTWTSEAGSEKTRKKLLVVKGTVNEKGNEWQEEWEYEITQAGLKKLEESMQAIEGVLRLKSKVSNNRNEISSDDILKGFKVGVIDEAGTRCPFATFTKGDLIMIATFENLEAWFYLRSAIVN